MTFDLETWLLEVGDEIIHKKVECEYVGLSDIEKAIYCLWVIDYAVRNSGTLEPMREIHETALAELVAFSHQEKLVGLSALLELAADEAEFCEKYYGLFDGACAEIKQIHNRF